MSASSKNSFHGSSNFKSNKKPFKPTFDKTFTDDKPVENGPQTSKNDSQGAKKEPDGAKKTNQEEQDELLVQKL